MKHVKALMIIILRSYLWNRISKSTKREYDSKSSHFPQRAADWRELQVAGQL